MMRATALVVAAFVTLAGGAPARAVDGAGVAGGATLAIVNADAQTMSAAGSVANATILIENGRIAALGADVALPAGVRVVDAGGHPVTPGFLSSATQLGLIEVSSSQDTVDRSESAGRLGASFDVRYGLNFNSTLIPIARADGLTHGVIVPGGSAVSPFAGVGALIDTGGASVAPERAGLAMFANLDSEGTSAAGRSRSAAWIVLRNALAEARAARGDSSGRRDLGAALDAADIAALERVLTGRMPLVIRARRESDIRNAVALGEDFDIRVIVYEGTEAWRAAELLAAHGVPVLLDPADNLPRRFDEIGARLDNAALLHVAGVPLGFYVSGIHTSHNAGLELRQRAGLAVANGLPRRAALAALTSGAARIWGVAAHAGVLETGRVADLVVWDGDPFEVTTAPVTVLLDGREVSLDTRQKQLAERYHPFPDGGDGER